MKYEIRQISDECRRIAELPPELQEITESNQFLGLEQKMLKKYVRYLSHRVQRCLYEICHEEGMDDSFTYKHFLTLMESSHVLRTLAASVVEHAVTSFIRTDCFRFSTQNIPGDIPSGDEKEMKQSIPLCSDDTANAVIEAFLLQTQVNYYIYLLNLGKNDTYAQYLMKLQEDETLWNTVLGAFRDGLVRLNFRESWFFYEIHLVWKEYMKMYQSL